MPLLFLYVLFTYTLLCMNHAERYWRKAGLLLYHSFIRDFYNESTAKNRILYFY